MPGVTPAEVLSNFGITLVEDPAENQPRLLVTAAAMYVAALNLYDPSQADGDATVFRAGLTNNKID